jgi:predicted dienelactone hydrolase
MTGDQLVARGQDIAFVVDEIGRRVASGDPALAGVNVDEMGMSGHSFGAQTTLAVAGQRYLGTDQTLKVNKFRAFIAFSPGAQVTTNLDYQFGSIDSPFLSFTGSQDQIPLTPDITPENRELPFENMKRGDKYLCFLDTATHMSFGGQQNARTDFLARLLQMNQSPPDQDHINQVVYTVSTAFWFAYLTPKTADGRAAKAWLKSGGPQSLCNPSDRWQMR